MASENNDTPNTVIKNTNKNIDHSNDYDKYSSSDSCNEEPIEWELESVSSLSDIDDDWDKDCIVIPSGISEKSIIGYYRECKNDGRPPKKKSKIDNELLFNDKLDAAQLFKHWTESSDYISDDIEFFSLPFKFCCIKKFVKNEFILRAIRDEMNTVKWNKRRLDLYEFYQTDDLCTTESVYLKQMYGFLKNDVMPWVSNATGLPLSRVSASCSFYSHTDHLLVHDDLQGDRCIAFILYLTGLDPQHQENIWKPEYGGALQLFNKNEAEQPYQVVKNLYPCHNQLVFFQVKRDSYHQVAEVETMNFSRLSINGWFHTEKVPLDEPPRLPTPTNGVFSKRSVSPIDLSPDSLKEYITALYFERKAIKSINRHIEESSEISLPNYFIADVFNNVFKAIADNGVVWYWDGPPNRRHYEVALLETLPKIASDFIELFKSLPMFTLFKKYTDLDLVPGENMHPTVRLELQRWTPGTYSLMSETCWFTESELDVIIYFGCVDEAEKNCPGQIIYVARSESDQDALVTLAPQNNTLNLIYRDEDTARIMPHIPHRSQNQMFYTLVCSYKQ